MATELQLNITTTANQAVVAAVGATNQLTNGGFESFTGSVPDNWTLNESPVTAQEVGTVYEGSSSLRWSHDGTGNHPNLHQIITIQDFMKGKTMRISGKIRSSSSIQETLSLSIGINNTLTPVQVIPTGSENTNVTTPETGVVFTFNYDNSQWYEFDYYYFVPESGITLAGPVLFPTAEDSTTEVFLDDLRIIFEEKDRSEAWRIDLEPQSQLIYGYGYGIESEFINDGLLPAGLNFFDVIGIVGDEEGYGLIEGAMDGELPGGLSSEGYSYAFGYEYAPAFIAGQGEKIDSITVKAVVYENNVRQPNIPIIFKASPYVCLTPNSTTTNDQGEALVTVSIDAEVLQNTAKSPSEAKLSQIPFNGYLTIFAEIDKHPRENEPISLIKTQALQLTETAVDIVDIGTYAFQKRFSTTYGFEGYGYSPPGVDFNC